MKGRQAAYAVLALVLATIGCGCTGGAGDGEAAQRVVVYTALDEMFSRPILERFEAETGIRVQAVYDTEAAKTTGLVTRLIAEASRPRADVFWNNEIVQTVLLKNEGVLEPYISPSAAAIPDAFKDPEGYWCGLAARARVIIYNTNLVADPPTSIRELLDARWRGKAAIARPLFGTTATHASVLFDLWGEEPAKEYFRGLLANDVAVLAGNATVRDLVAMGEYEVGLTDTDDANGAVVDGRPAKWLFPDQDNELGALVIPNSVALIRGAPNAEAGQRLIDYLLSPEVERALAESRSIQIPLNPAVEAPDDAPALADIRATEADFAAAAAHMEAVAAFVQREMSQ